MYFPIVLIKSSDVYSSYFSVTAQEAQKEPYLKSVQHVIESDVTKVQVPR